MSGKPWTQQEIELARQMLAARAKDAEFKSRLGRSKNAAQTRILYDATSVERYLLAEPRVEVPEQAWADADRREKKAQSLTALLCGDPPPGYSALDMRERQVQL